MNRFMNNPGDAATEASPSGSATDPSLVRLESQTQRAQRLESIGMLASGIAHDLNNVLAPIILAAPLLREHVTDPEDIRLISALEKSAERGVELVRQILSYAHGVGVAERRIQVRELVREAAVLATETFPKNISVIQEVPENIWPVIADQTQIHQILLNLCVNARDAMPRGGTLTIGVENCLLDEATAQRIDGGRAGAWVVLHVEDTGSGIPVAVLSHIWEPFYTTKGPGKGTGLGLSTVRGAVAHLKGFIGLKSQLGHGTSFRIYLPAAEEPAPVRPVSVAKSAVCRGNGELIMVVDDEPQIREMTTAMLSRNGYRVISASDGNAAVTLFSARSTEINLVITDLNIPHMDGAALGREIRRLNPNVRVLGMSGLSTGVLNGKLSHFEGAFIHKPFKVQALLEEIHKLLHPAPALV